MPPVRWQVPLAAAVLLSLAVVALSFSMPILLGLTWDDWQHNVRGWFDVGNEHNLPTWWNTLLLICAATLTGLVALLHSRTRTPGGAAWGILAGLIALLSLDEAGGLHERLRFVSDAVAPQHGFTYAWLAVGIPLGVLLLIAVWMLARRVGAVPRRLLAGGLAVLLLGAVGLETVNDLLVQAAGSELPPGGSLTFHAIYHLEELLELIGSSMLLVAPLSALRMDAEGGRLVVRVR